MYQCGCTDQNRRIKILNDYHHKAIAYDGRQKLGTIKTNKFVHTSIEIKVQG